MASSSTLMASSSTAPVRNNFKYEIFLSFRGEDTRTNFIDHLYLALKQKSILTYKDDQAIRKGGNISDELIRAIEDSRFYIIVFSKNYASSAWCLEELVKIMECNKMTEHTAFPVFYDVEPTEVRKQSGAVGEAFAKHQNNEAAGKWKQALKEASDLAGWELKSTANGHEAQCIQEIVKEISEKLPSNNFIDGRLVGMETRVNNVVSVLETYTDDVRLIGIWGIGGGGKTTLARAVSNRISFQFECKCFVENVREVSKNPSFGLKSLQKQILSNVLNDRDINVDGIHDGIEMMMNKMRGRQVLLVLDDVDHIKQLEALAGDPDWFNPGSIIIITTRDKKVLEAHRVKLILDVKLLSWKEQRCLFNRYAFEGEIPIQGYGELSEQFINYAQGLPLTIKVLGSLLCGIKDKSEWRDTLKRLKKIPLYETLKILELSYESLEKEHKEIFLDVACILKGRPKDDAIQVLESCGFHARHGLKVLEKKSLISIEHNYYGDERVGMHDHIEEMGKNIVHRSHPKPQKRSRLWIDEEIKKILANDSGTKATRCIQFHTEKINPEIIMKGFIKMKELRFLDVRVDDTNRLPSNVSPCFPDSLQFLSWYQYPFMYLPKTFEANNLVTLVMASSNIVQLWEAGGEKVLNKLKFLNLSYSKLTTLDLGLIPNLEVFSLEECYDLVQLHKLDGCLNLISVNLNQSRLKTIDLRSAVNLERVKLKGCNVLVELHLPDECLKLTHLECTRSKLKIIDLRSAVNLALLDLSDCNGLVEIQFPDGCLKLRHLDCTLSKLKTVDLRSAVNLELLDLRDCNGLVELYLPDRCVELTRLYCTGSKLKTVDLRSTVNLEVLDLGDSNDLVELHLPDECLKLTNLECTRSKLKIIDLRSAVNLELLDLRDCNGLVELHLPDGCVELTRLYCTGSKLKTVDLHSAVNLEVLVLRDSNDLVELHLSYDYLKLTDLKCMGSTLKTVDHRSTVNLEQVNHRNCEDLVELHLPDGCLKLRHLDCMRSKLKTVDLRSAVNLELLDLRDCNDLEELHLADGCLKLTHLQCTRSKLKTVDLHSAVNLEEINLLDSNDLVELHLPDGCLKLRHLDCTRSKLKTVDLRSAVNLELLDLRDCNDLVEFHLPDGCVDLARLYCTGSKLKTVDIRLAVNIEIAILNENRDLVKFQMPGECLNLKYLKLNNSKLTTLDIGSTPKLEFLDLKNCYNLEELHMVDTCQKLEYLNISNTKLRTLDLGLTPNLENLDLKECNNLVQVHAPTGCLENLVYLRFSSFLFIKRFEAFSGMDRSLEEGPLAELCLIAKSLERCPLHPDNTLPKFESKCFYNDHPSLTRILETLISVDLCACTNFEMFSQIICGLLQLEKLKIDGYPAVPKDIDQLECLEHLQLSSLKMEHLPDNICMLKHLKTLVLESCCLLQKLPEDLGLLECLKELILSSEEIKQLPDSICMLKRLKILELSECLALEKLPEDLGLLESLVTLNLSSTKIKYLPDTFCMLRGLRHLNLNHCSLLEKLPEDLDRLECLELLSLMQCSFLKDIPSSICELESLKKLNLEGTCIDYLPKSIHLLEGLRIYGSREFLQACGFTSILYEESYYVDV